MRPILSRPIDDDLADEIRQFRSPTDGTTRMFYEIVIAPGYTEEGLAKLKGKSKTLRILEAQSRAPSGRSLRQIQGKSSLLVFLRTDLCKIADSIYKIKVACLCLRQSSNAIESMVSDRLVALNSSCSAPGSPKVES